MQNLREKCYAASRRLDPFKESAEARRIQRAIDRALNEARGHISGEVYARKLRQALDLVETYLRNR